ncbi:hypothetical protein U9M48_011407 [Paspalum notatum var. saurae]|uniref:N-acetyltransferase domain-containing protein n=1 Tax=Paspalum notatum var. saurae TaxID=547442 RepID=A0AAQ3SVL3_PASNO
MSTVVPVPATVEDGWPAVAVREFDAAADLAAVERLERACEVGPSSGKLCLFTDLLGDPLCRVRHSPAYLMLVAEAPAGGDIVGVVRGCVKTVACGRFCSSSAAAYLLGLRVAPAHRRRGVGRGLVARMEDWFRQAGAHYAYVATDRDNEPCFRAPSVLVHPVFRHDLANHPPHPAIAVLRVPPRDAERLYRARFSGVEFFPTDIDAVLANPLSLGTFLAVPAAAAAAEWRGADAFLAAPPASWAVASVWNCKDACGARRGCGALSRAPRAADRALSRLRILRVPSVPNLFEPFGMHFLYGLGGDGPAAPAMARALCRHAHDLARRAGARVVATELAESDPIISGVPHWPRLGAQDLWCIKRLADGYGDGALGDWTRRRPATPSSSTPGSFSCYLARRRFVDQLVDS